MACFLASAAEAAVVHAVKKAEEKKEKKEGVKEGKIPWSRKLSWLTWMLCGGVVLLLFEHIWHGEVVPWFPFLTAMSSPEDTAEMLREIATVGVCMAVLITVVWLVMCKVADVIAKRNLEAKGEAE
jgi:flagellar biosynthesis protein FlhB